MVDRNWKEKAKETTRNSNKEKKADQNTIKYFSKDPKTFQGGYPRQSMLLFV